MSFKKLYGLDIKSDGGWVSGGRSNCYEQFTRQIIFSKSISFEDAEAVFKLMQDNGDCPGWVDRYLKVSNENEVVFRSGCDSSD